MTTAATPDPVESGCKPASPRSPAIRVQNLRKHYGSLVALRGLDFQVEPGEIFGLIGPDGAGKTTTFQILAGVVAATAGEVRVLDRPPRDARLQLGYLTQQFSLYPDLSILENLRYSARLRQVSDRQFQQRAPGLLARVGLTPFGDRLAGRLSGGMKQKLALCCALVPQPQILLLDEPTTGVDPVSRREFWDLLAAVAADGVTIVAATPYLDEAERCHRIALIYDGQIQQLGTLAELRASLGLHRLELRLEAVAPAAARLQAALQDKIVDVQSFGDRLDVLVSDAAAGEQQVRQVLRGLPLQSLNHDEPTLENVFVTRLRQQGSEPPFIPFPYAKAARTSTLSQTGSTLPVAIGAQQLAKQFGDFWAVKQINLEVCYGEIYGLLGANGAGKTTTIKMLCGLLPPSAGTMQLAGETQALDRAAVRSRLGYMSQKFTLYDDLTIQQNLEFYCGVYGVPRRRRREKIHWVLETCGLVGREKTVTGRLPGGWKQRVAFGASVLHEPSILFLDEPTSGVDPLARRQFWRLIRAFAQRGTAVLVTTHYLEEAENCHRMGFMVAGEIVAQGSPSAIKAQQPGQLLEWVTDQPQAAATLLKTVLEPWRVAIFGTRLHIVLEEPEQGLPPLRDRLRTAGITIQAERPIPFSLEDAFIGTVQRSQAGN